MHACSTNQSIGIVVYQREFLRGTKKKEEKERKREEKRGNKKEATSSLALQDIIVLPRPTLPTPDAAAEAEKWRAKRQRLLRRRRRRRRHDFDDDDRSLMVASTGERTMTAAQRLRMEREEALLLSSPHNS